MNGWVKAFRSTIEWEWFTDVPTAHLWMYILLRANSEDEMWRGMLIRRGSFVTSEDKLAVETGLSRQQVRTALKKLVSTNEITKQTTNNYTLINVNKYADYQQANQQSTSEVTNEITNGVTSGATTNKKRRREEEKNNKETAKEKRPTLDEVKAYCQERNSGVDPDRWFNYYSSNGFRVGRNPMKDWRACIRSWERKDGKTETLPTYDPSSNRTMGDDEKEELLKLMGRA